ncbi:procathepsin L-like [Halichondria panicea]|uniref:procathepsin L-like n=1 Tax=Halichondria panicea TaxID=6063 RepID=UPI00312BCBDD
MLVSVIAVLGLVAVSSAVEPKYEFVEEWQVWKSRHEKIYDTHLVELEKHLTWLSNKKYIEQHNANSHIFGFTLAMNKFGDMTELEWTDYLSTYQVREQNENGNYSKTFQPESQVYDYPEAVDWRTKGAVTAVKDQGDCGASYAFSAMGALEGAYALAHGGNRESLSEQNIIDCSIPYGNHGCHGGNMYDAFLYVIANDGVSKESAYPFFGKQSYCNYQKTYRGTSMSGSVSIKSGSEEDLLTAVANVGPVSVAIDGANSAFRFYYSGVYDSSRCTSSSLNHAMVITGYGSYSGKKYWLAKNSWGTNWGQSGFVMMARDKYNQCGIASDASYPTL